LRVGPLVSAGFRTATSRDGAVEEAWMERVYFRCPNTDKKVDAGIESELGTLLRIREERVRAFCPHCADWHEWMVRDALIEKAA
jgi:hypothetical protein